MPVAALICNLWWGGDFFRMNSYYMCRCEFLCSTNVMFCWFPLSFKTLEFMIHLLWRPYRISLLLGSPLGLMLFPCRYKYWVRHVVPLKGGDGLFWYEEPASFLQKQFWWFSCKLFFGGEKIVDFEVDFYLASKSQGENKHFYIINHFLAHGPRQLLLYTYWSSAIQALFLFFAGWQWLSALGKRMFLW